MTKIPNKKHTVSPYFHEYAAFKFELLNKLGDLLVKTRREENITPSEVLALFPSSIEDELEVKKGCHHENHRP